MATQNIHSDLNVTGAFTANTMAIPNGTVTNASVAAGAAIARTKLDQDAAVEYPILATDWRVHDNFTALLPAAAATDDLGILQGTIGSNFPTLQAGDVGGTTSVRYARCIVAIPAEYDAGQTVTVRCRARVSTTVCDTSCTVDIEAYEHDGDAAVGVDLCSTSATSMNTTSYANYDFAITPASLAAGDQLDIRVAISYNDAGNAGVMIPTLSKVSMLYDIRG